jgi:hypothetical protein
LIRLYLGRRLGSKEKRPLSTKENFSLRNFPLHINEMENLGLNTHHYAKIMAQTLALLHCSVKIDANDVEFVLGTTASPYLDLDSDESNIPKEEREQYVGKWLLDFNRCTSFEETEGRIKELVDGFYWNDPYYPRPDMRENKEDVKL